MHESNDFEGDARGLGYSVGQADPLHSDRGLRCLRGPDARSREILDREELIRREVGRGRQFAPEARTERLRVRG